MSKVIEKSVLISVLPYLRRYARALLGEQRAADSLVMATVHALATKNLAGAPVKDSLFRLFHQVLDSPAGFHLCSLEGFKHSQRSVVESRLSSLPVKARQVLLLSSVEEFSDKQIAYIIDVELAAVESLKSQARDMIVKHVATDVVIIEDEMFIADDLCEIMESLGHRVVATARTHKAAVKAIAAHNPGLILTYIQLADGSSGLDAVYEAAGTTQVPIIFITAYPERLLTGMSLEPTFLITKPFLAESVAAVASQALFFDAKVKRAQSDAAQLRALG